MPSQKFKVGDIVAFIPAVSWYVLGGHTLSPGPVNAGARLAPNDGVARASDLAGHFREWSAG
jgi:hypothetical protein